MPFMLRQLGLKQLALSLGLLCLAADIGAQQAAPANTPAPLLSTVEKVTVTADRGLAGINDSASSVAVLSQQQIQQRAGFTLDDALRAVSGFQLFRRTSSWTANPTSQGLSLRGLGSTAASRTLVVSDQVPLNDAFGGWVHWNEIPLLAIDHVELLRGGAADLYGSSAIGGAVDVVPLTPAGPPRVRFTGDASGASQDTAQQDGALSLAARRFALLGAYSGLRTNGYIPTAPAARGPIDAPSNVHGQSARIELRAPFAAGSAFLRGNVLDEARGNGSPLQTNATRLWRYQAGADALSPRWGRAVARAYGSRESYRQSFSSITSVAAVRDTERLTRLQQVPTDEFGAVLQGSRAFASVTAALGLDLRDIRATDNETAVANAVIGATTSASARQREVGGYADAIWQPRDWSISGSVRVDSFRTFDAQQTASNTRTVTVLPALPELVVSPRLGLVRKLPKGFALTGTAFRAFRGPTMNELYRTGQVGQQTTLANASLLAERATGFEFGGDFARRRIGSVRSTYFWTEVNRPISAVLLSSTATTQTLQRQNLGQIRSRGVMVEAQTESRQGISASVSYQFAVATVTRFNSTFAAQKNLAGNWIPQVARHSLTTRLRYDAPRIATFSASLLYSGRQFDDAENAYLLHPFARFDLYAERPLGHGFSLFGSTQNVGNRAIDAGRTPILTLAPPRVVQAGVRFALAK